MKILIDTDPFVYRIAWAAQPNCYWVNNIPFDTKAEAVNYCCRHEFDIASIEKEQFLFSPRYVKQFVKAQLRPVVNNCATALEEKEDADICQIEVYWFLSSKVNARKFVDPEYKATRREPPRWREYVKQLITDQKDPVIIKGLEADDVIAWKHYQNWTKGLDSCIVSIDKDLKNIPGHYYNPNTGLCESFSLDDCFQSFCKQFLTGDSSDNIPGIKGVAENTANKLFEEFLSENHVDINDAFFKFKDFCIVKYAKDFADPEERFNINFSLLDVGGVWSHILNHPHHLEVQLRPLRGLQKQED